jgi:hypothetical protein
MMSAVPRWLARTRASLALLVFIVSAAPRALAADRPFDGSWVTILSCENAAGALGYSFKFVSAVKDSVLHGERGTNGKPGWLQIDGKISPEGQAKLYADGLVGASETAVGRQPKGTPYGYHIDAKFEGDSGMGKRVEGRPCSITFERKH